VGGTTQTSNGGSGPRAPPPKPSGPIAKTLNSQSANVDVGSLPLTRGEQWILTANVRVSGTVKCVRALGWQIWSHSAHALQCSQEGVMEDSYFLGLSHPLSQTLYVRRSS